MIKSQRYCVSWHSLFLLLSLFLFLKLCFVCDFFSLSGETNEVFIYQLYIPFASLGVTPWSLADAVQACDGLLLKLLHRFHCLHIKSRKKFFGNHLLGLLSSVDTSINWKSLKLFKNQIGTGLLQYLKSNQ